MSLPTLADLKAETNIPNSASDDELELKLDQAVALVEGLVGPIDVPASVTETHRNVSSDVLVLRRMPAAELVSVSARHGAVSTALLLADYELDASTGLLRSAVGARFAGTYVVTYTVGYDALPADIAGAVILIAAHLWETQRGTSPSAFAVQQDTFTDPGTFGAAYAIPNRAKELLAPHVRPAIA